MFLDLLATRLAPLRGKEASSGVLRDIACGHIAMGGAPRGMVALPSMCWLVVRALCVCALVAKPGYTQKEHSKHLKCNERLDVKAKSLNSQ